MVTDLLVSKIKSILFVVPPHPACGIELISGGVHPPYAFLSLAEWIKDIVSRINIVDCPAKKINNAELLKIIRREQPDLIGLTSLTYYSEHTLSLAKRIREISKAIIVGGGPHFSYEYETAFNNGFDVVCRFSAGDNFRRLILQLNNGQDFSSIPNLVYKKNGEIVVNRSSQTKTNIPNFSISTWQLISPDDYWWWFHSPHNISLNTSRGCGKKCRFCLLPIYWGKFSQLSALEIINTVEFLSGRYKKTYFWFTDDDFLTSSETFGEFCNLLIERNINIKWFFQTRCDRVVQHKALLRKARAAGAFFVLLGAETYSDRRLKELNKNLTAYEVEQANKILDDLGFLVWNSFIVGLKNDGEEELKRTYTFAKKLNSLIVTFTPLTPVPGIELWDSQKENLEYSKISMYDSVLPTSKLTRKQLDKKILSMYIRYYTRVLILRKLLSASVFVKKIVLRFYTSGSVVAISRVSGVAI